MDVHVVIMAGGVGSRLWPLSTAQLPKQFIDLLGVGKTMLQLTVERFLALCPISNIWIVTSEKYTEIVKTQIPGLSEDHILNEPEARNTAPCIAYACKKIEIRHPNATVIVSPADAIILNDKLFVSILQKAADFASQSGNIVTIGIRPNKAETAYGYICAEAFVENEIVKVKSFKEKPSLDLAQEYLKSGNYFWNAGIFIWSVKTINREIERHIPKINSLISKMAEAFYSPNEQEAVQKYFPLCDKISIDYAVMEKSDNIYVIAADLSWSDLGSWTSLSEFIPKSIDSNSVVGGDIRLFDCKDCVVHADDIDILIAQGLDSYIVVAKDKKLVICKKSEAQDIKKFIK